jgi:hypothetical protein
MDTIEVLLAIYLLQVLLVFLLLTINLPHKLPIVFPYLSTFCLIYKSIFGFGLSVQYLLFFLKLENLLVEEEEHVGYA